VRLTRPFVLGAIAAAIAVGPVAGQQALEIADTGTITPGERAQATVVITVNCVADPAFPTGTATIELEQQQRGGVVTGSGTTSVTCDGVTRTYPLAVTAATGDFRRGTATASGQVTFLYTLCAVNEQGEMFCTTFPLTMVAEPQPIGLRVGR
jgi:L-asparaginase II